MDILGFMITVLTTGVISETQVEQFAWYFVFRIETRYLVLKNPSPLPVVYQLSGLQDVDKEVQCSGEKGTVGPLSTRILEFTLKSAQPIVILNKSFKLEVFNSFVLLMFNCLIRFQVCVVN